MFLAVETGSDGLCHANRSCSGALALAPGDPKTPNGVTANGVSSFPGPFVDADVVNQAGPQGRRVQQDVRYHKITDPVELQGAADRRDRSVARVAVGDGLSVSAFPLYVPD